MKIRRFLSILSICTVLFLVALPSFLVCPRGAGAEILTGGNDIYRIHVNSEGTEGVGMYTATTGPGHPVGPGLDVMYGGGEPWTSFTTIRSYNSGTDYIMGPASWYVSSTDFISLEPYGTVTPIGTQGFFTEFVLPGPPETPDRLTILSYVTVHGITYGESTIEVRTTVINDNSDVAEVGISYLFDFQIGSLVMDPDDGPTFQQINPDGPVLTFETEFTHPPFESYLIVDNDQNVSPPTFFVLGTVNGPAAFNPTHPDLLQYTCWPESSLTVFDYTIDPALEIATADAVDCSGPSGGDTAVLYYFGATEAESYRLFQKEEKTVSASLFLTPPISREVILDVKPGSCENPININSGGLTPMALVGMDDFDISEIDPQSLFVEGVRASRTSVEDVSSPGNLLDTIDGCAGGPDGVPDLTIKFDTRPMMKTLERQLGRPLRDGNRFVITISGRYKEEFGGEQFQARDLIRIISKGKK